MQSGQHDITHEQFAMDKNRAGKVVPDFWLIVVITLTGTMAMHIVIPSLPLIARDMVIGGTGIQLTTSLYIAGSAAGQLIYGPVSDGLGRRPVLLTGLLAFLAGTVLAALAPDFSTLIAARLLQGFGAGAGLALGRAIVRDTTDASTAVRKMAILNVLIVLGPGLAPFVGGVVAVEAGWRAVFGVLTLIGGVTVLLTWRLLPETHAATGKLAFRSLFLDGAKLMRSRKFGGLLLGNGCMTYVIYAVLSTVPFIFIDQLNLSVKAAGVCSGLIVLGSAAGNLLTARLAGAVRGMRLLYLGNWIVIGCSLVFTLLVLHGLLTPANVVLVLCVFSLGTGLANPVALAEALAVDPRRAGSAAGIFGCLQLVIATILTVLMSLGSDPALSMAIVLCGCALASRVAFVWSQRP